MNVSKQAQSFAIMIMIIIITFVVHLMAAHLISSEEARHAIFGDIAEKEEQRRAATVAPSCV
jgi:flagellar basal body-associated protein FliL